MGIELSKSELVNQLSLIDSVTAECFVYVPFFSDKIKLIICFNQSMENDLNLTEGLYQSYLELVRLQINEIDLSIINKEIYDDFNKKVNQTSYGFVSDEVSKTDHAAEVKANYDHFNIFSPQEAFKSLILKYAMFVEYQNKDAVDFKRYVSLAFNRKWDMEHELLIVFEKGKFFQIE